MNLRIILVATSHPGNIGATARAMKTMGLTRLYLVTPKIFPHPDATAMAAGAEDILESATLCDSLDVALRNCHLVLGTSARIRQSNWPLLNPRECAKEIASHPHSEIALVFGRENNGLTNEELERCHYQVNIPSNPNYASLNLAAAVQIIAYEIYQALQAHPYQKNANPTLATVDELELYYQQLQQFLAHTQFLKSDNPVPLMSKIRRLYARIQLEKDEINILQGILKSMHKGVTLPKSKKLNKGDKAYE